MWKNIKPNLVIMASLCVGMVIPLITLADIQYFFEYGDTIRTAVMDSAAFFYSAEPQKSASEIYNALSEVSVIQRAAIMKSDRREVRYAEGEYYETVSAASGETFDFYLPCMVSGRCFEAEDFTGEAGVCLVEKNFFQDNGLTRKPGEKLVIDGTEYTVAGIGRKFDSRGRIWIPWNQASSVQGGSGEIQVIVQYEPGTDFVKGEGGDSPIIGNYCFRGNSWQNYQMMRISENINIKRNLFVMKRYNYCG